MDPCRCYHKPLLRRQFRVPFLLKKDWFCLYQLLFKMDGCAQERLERSLLLQSEILTQPLPTPTIIPHGRIQTVIKNISKKPKDYFLLQTIYKQRNLYITKKQKNQTGKRHQKKHQTKTNDNYHHSNSSWNKIYENCPPPFLLRELRRYPKKISKS